MNLASEAGVLRDGSAAEYAGDHSDGRVGTRDPVGIEDRLLTFGLQTWT